MSCLGTYQLYWSDDGVMSPANGDKGTSARCGQHVFTSSPGTQAGPRLRRVRTVQDFVEAISGSSRSVDWAAVAALAMLCGNLVATGQWLLLVLFLLAGMVLAVLELRVAATAELVALSLLLLSSVRSGMVGFHWMATVTAIVLFAVLALTATSHAVREDPRGHALVCERSSKSVKIRNDCCMDVKMLIFDATDVVRLVPHGGLLGGVLVRRGALYEVGSESPYIVKFYAPWGRELGAFLVEGGIYSFRATAPPIVLAKSPSPTFTNRSEEPVLACRCGQCWTNSLWVPMAPLFARLRWPSKLVLPGNTISLDGPCLLRVYVPRSVDQRACAVLFEGESSEYLGPVLWSTGRGNVRKSVSSMFNVIH